MEEKVVGVDLGNVVIGGGTTAPETNSEAEDTSFFGDNFLKTPKIPGSFEAVREIAEKFDVWIVSKCGQKVQDKSLAWLEHHKFFEITGVKREQVIFCRKRSEKAGIAQSLGLFAFIDDREDIIQSMQGVVEKPLLFTSWEETRAMAPELFS